MKYPERMIWMILMTIRCPDDKNLHTMNCPLDRGRKCRWSTKGKKKRKLIVTVTDFKWTIKMKKDKKAKKIEKENEGSSSRNLNLNKGDETDCASNMRSKYLDIVYYSLIEGNWQLHLKGQTVCRRINVKGKVVRPCRVTSWLTHPLLLPIGNPTTERAFSWVYLDFRTIALSISRTRQHPRNGRSQDTTHTLSSQTIFLEIPYLYCFGKVT